MKYHFIFPIGDAFDDGHGNCREVYATAEKPVAAVQYANLQIQKVTGIDLNSFCCEYGDTIIPESVLETLDKLGYKFLWELHKDDMGTHLLEKDTGCDIPEEMANIWAFLLNQVDPDLRVQLSLQMDFPYLLVSGDHPVGYGLFC